MQPVSAGKPRDNEAAREHLRANIGAAAAAHPEPGHWELHHIADLSGGPGDFTPYRAPDYAEHEAHPLGEWLEALAGILGPDLQQPVMPRLDARRGLEAGQ